MDDKGQTRSGYHSLFDNAGKPPPIVSKMELDRLREEQAKERPRQELHYTIDGIEEQETHNALSKQRSDRIKYFESRLGEQQSKPSRDFSR